MRSSHTSVDRKGAGGLQRAWEAPGLGGSGVGVTARSRFKQTFKPFLLAH
jgi:hypothetical protein